MTVQELIDALESCENKDAVIVHYNATENEYIYLTSVVEDEVNRVKVN